jgi:hypothetical protein
MMGVKTPIELALIKLRPLTGDLPFKDLREKGGGRERLEENLFDRRVPGLPC